MIWFCYLFHLYWTLIWNMHFMGVMVLQMSFQTHYLCFMSGLKCCFLLNLFALGTYSPILLIFWLLDISSSGNGKFIENKALLNYSKLSDGVEAVKPSSMVLSEFHFLLFLENMVKVCMHLAFLKETDGLLKIEDILPFFPDFALIDDFKVQLYLLSDFRFTWQFSRYTNDTW